MQRLKEQGQRHEESLRLLDHNCSVVAVAAAIAAAIAAADWLCLSVYLFITCLLLRTTALLKYKKVSL